MAVIRAFAVIACTLALALPAAAQSDNERLIQATRDPDNALSYLSDEQVQALAEGGTDPDPSLANYSPNHVRDFLDVSGDAAASELQARALDPDEGDGQTAAADGDSAQPDNRSDWDRLSDAIDAMAEGGDPLDELSDEQVGALAEGGSAPHPAFNNRSPDEVRVALGLEDSAIDQAARERNLDAGGHAEGPQDLGQASDEALREAYVLDTQAGYDNLGASREEVVAELRRRGLPVEGDDAGDNADSVEFGEDEGLEVGGDEEGVEFSEDEGLEVGGDEEGVEFSEDEGLEVGGDQEGSVEFSEDEGLEVGGDQESDWFPDDEEGVEFSEDEGLEVGGDEEGVEFSEDEGLEVGGDSDVSQLSDDALREAYVLDTPAGYDELGVNREDVLAEMRRRGMPTEGEDDGIIPEEDRATPTGALTDEELRMLQLLEPAELQEHHGLHWREVNEELVRRGVRAEAFPCNDGRMFSIVGFLQPLVAADYTNPMARGSIRPITTGILGMAEAVAADHGEGCAHPDWPDFTVGDALWRLRLLMQ